MNWNLDGILFGLFVLCAVPLIGFLGYAMYQESKEEQRLEQACYAVKGEWYKPYRSRGVCLKPGSVIHP